MLPFDFQISFHLIPYNGMYIQVGLGSQVPAIFALTSSFQVRIEFLDKRMRSCFSLAQHDLTRTYLINRDRVSIGSWRLIHWISPRLMNKINRSEIRPCS